MNWYRVSIEKNNKIIVAANFLEDTLTNAIKSMLEYYPQYSENKGYIVNAELMYDGH